MPLLTDANLPLKNGYLELAASGESLRAVAFDLARNLDVMSAGRSLPPPSSLTWSVVRRVDTMSSAYDPAGAAGVPPGDAPLDPNVAGVVVKLEYLLPQPTAAEPRLSVRVNGFRARARPVQTIVHYTNGSTVRTLTMTGTPRRVDLEPGWRVVAPLFARLGMERLTLGVEHLLFILCLAIPRRTLREVLEVLGAFAGGFTAALA